MSKGVFKIMKKILSAVLASALAIPVSFSIPVSAENGSWQSDTEMMALLSGLDIMVGDGNGNYNLDAYVSRAEMAKLAVATSEYKDTVAVQLQFSPFSDVSGSHWASPYIQAAVSAGYVKGYIDGTFDPDGTVKYEEAVTMMLRVLGYTDDDFGASYPYGQIGVANGKKMTDGMNAEIGEPLTRRQVAHLISNTLTTVSKKTNADLINVHDCTLIEDVTILSGADENDSLDYNEIMTSSGKYEIDDSFDAGYIGSKGDLVIKDGKYVVAFSNGSESTSDQYVIYSTLNDAILCYKMGDTSTIKQLDISSSTTCYVNSTASTYSNVRSMMSMGDVIRVRYNSNGTIDYINYSEGTVDGPTKVTSDSWISQFNTDSSTKYMRDGSETTQSGIKTNDIVYYSKNLNMILAYSNKVTGVYENASPSKDNPSSVTISGVTYEVEGVEAYNDFASSVNYGDTVTVLLGRDGTKAAGVVTSTTGSTSVVGYVTETGRKNFNNSDGTEYTSYYVQIVTADGTVYTYPTEHDVSIQQSKVVRATIKDGKANIGVISSSSSLSGYVDYSKMTIGSKSVSSDVKILDTVSMAYSNTTAYTKTYMQRIDGIELTASNVIYYSTNSAGQIDELILHDVTGDMYSYGLVTKFDSSTLSSTIDVSGSLYTSSLFQVMRGTGVKIIINSSTVEYANQLTSVSGTATDLTQSTVKINGNTYKLSDKVAVYKEDGSWNYSYMSLNDAINGDYKYTCYRDKSEDKGGRIRVIVVKD